MSQFPDEEEHQDQPEHTDPDNGMHPGFWSHFRRKRVSGASDATGTSGGQNSVPMNAMKNNSSTRVREAGRDDGAMTPFPSIYSVPDPQNPSAASSNYNEFPQDTSYGGAGAGTPGSTGSGNRIHWTPSSTDPNIIKSRAALQGSHDSFGPPLPPLPPGATPGGSHPNTPRDTARRQFSFQNVFHRARSPRPSDTSSAGGSQIALDGPPQPPGSRGALTRSALSFSRKSSSGPRDTATEEERLGLVRGDSAGDGASDELPPGYNSSRSSGDGAAVKEGRGEHDTGTVVRKDRTRRSDDSDRDGGSGAAKELSRGMEGRAFI
jgi:hypothetical protein